MAAVRGCLRWTGSKYTSSQHCSECVAIHANGLTRSDVNTINSGGGCDIRRRGGWRVFCFCLRGFLCLGLRTFFQRLETVAPLDGLLNARGSMMARSTTLQHKAGYIDARPPTASSSKSSCYARPDHTSGSNPVFERSLRDVRFSNGPFRVKHFQTIRRCSVDVAHGLALLFGIGAKALPLWDSRMRWSNLCSGLAVRRNGRSKRTCELTSSIVPRGTSSTARWSSSFLLLDLIL